MSQHVKTQQNKIRLIAVFLFTVVLVLAFQFVNPSTQPDKESGKTHSGELRDKATETSMFMGLRHAKASEVRAVLPETDGQPTLLSFGSKLCYDCKRMMPVLEKLQATRKGVSFIKVDITEDRDRRPAVFRTFQPVSVPMLVFIDARGEIRNVLYNYQKPEVIAGALDGLQRQSGGATIPSTP